MRPWLDPELRWIFADLGLPPHSVARCLVAGSPLAAHAVDVSGHLDAAVASLRAHGSYLEALGDHPMADPEFVRAYCEQVGVRAGVGAAVPVELFG